MRVGVLIALLGAGGCDRLFGLETVRTAEVADAPPIADAHTPVVVDGCWDAFYQDDEDEDGLVDGCDNCPLDPNVDQAETDGDGIGDACDPNPAHPIERRAFFDPMVNLNPGLWEAHGTLNLAGWRTTDEVVGYGIKQPNRGSSGHVLDTTLRLNRAFNQPSVQLRLWSSVPDTDAADESAAGLYIVTPPYAETSPAGAACAVRFAGTDPNDYVGFVRTALGESKFEDAEIKVFAVRNVIRLITQRPGLTPDQMVQPTCDMTSTVNGMRMTNEATSTLGIIPMATQVGLWTENASATFVAILVYERIP